MSKIYEIMENIQGNYVEAYLISYNEFKELKQALEDKDQEIERYKVSVIPNYYNIMKSQQSKIDKIKEVYINFTQEDFGTPQARALRISKEIKQILEED